jgi:hypothetical protein
LVRYYLLILLIQKCLYLIIVIIHEVEMKTQKVEMKSRNGRNYVISHDFLYIEKTKKNKRCTISVNIAPIRMKQLPFDSSRLGQSNELTFIDFGSSHLKIFAIVFRNPDSFI